MRARAALAWVGDFAGVTLAASAVLAWVVADEGALVPRVEGE